MRKSFFLVLLCLFASTAFAAVDGTGATAPRDAAATAGAATVGAATVGAGAPAASAAPAGMTSSAAALPGGALPTWNALPVADQRPALVPALPQMQSPLPGKELPAALPLRDPVTGQELPPSPDTVPPQPLAVTEPAAEASLIEQAMAGEELSGPMRPQPFRLGKLAQFGYGFFKKTNAFAPVADAPVGPEYVVGPGDTLLLTVSGSLEGSFPLEVNRSGEVILPKVGAVRVWGVRFGRLPELLKSQLSQSFRNVQVSVSMGKLRLIKVYLVGEVEAPGDYDLSSLSTVINALAAAGGPARSGSLRNIQVLRDGKSVETVDLYDFFLKGDKSRDVRLQPGDTVYVPMIGKVAGVGGNVRRPGIYELKGEATLAGVLELAGGVNPSGYLNRLQISRVQAHDKKVVADFELDPTLSGQELARKSAGISIQDMDLVKVFPIDFTLRNNVVLEGYVLRPGPYALKPGMRLADLVGPDNFLPEYYPEIVEITRLVPPYLHPEKMFVNLARAQQGVEQDNILLQEFDVVRVFSRWEMEELPKVRISGEVQRPGEYRLFDRMTLRDLVLAAGNVKKSAYTRATEIVRLRITGSSVNSHPITVSLEQALKGVPEANLLLQDKDEVMIRKLPEWMDETDRYVTLGGEVQFPGVYPIFKAEKLSSVLRRAGGFTDKAHLKGAKFTRRSVRDLQQRRMDEMLARVEQDLARKQQELAQVAASKEELEATKATIDGMRASLEKLKTAKAEGRMSLTITSLEGLAGSPFDLELQGGDMLEIPQSTNSIQVFGEVYNPTTLVHVPGKELKFYLDKAGGATVNGEKDEIYLIRADGTVESRQAKKRFLFYDSFDKTVLDAGDTVVVPQVIEKVAWMRELKDIAFIIGQAALAAGVIVAAGN